MHEKFPPERAALAKEIEDVGSQHIHIPKLPLTYAADRYLNVTPEFLRDSLKGKIVLIDIWDYTCINCIQTLPYIKAWNERYKDKGLVIIGVHAPEFEFEKDPKNLDSAVKEFGLNYPIIADNDYEIWNSLANQYWPAKYLFDSKGILRAEHFGEGEYQEFEAFLQKILLERDPTLDLPDLIPPVRESDKPGAVCYRATPETYIGFSRNHLGNEAKDANDKTYDYALPKSLAKDKLYLDGDWTVRNEYAQPTAQKDASLVFDYQAKEANLVIHPLAETDFKVIVMQDGKPLAKEDRGMDVQEAPDGQTFLDVREARMYRITNNQDFGRHTLKLTASTPSFGAYAFTFTTACKH
ncbi:MAG TPA: redoxin domain-containing protein [Candidatus Kapabacteria bacterium]|jgi:thiol-disulfide isomerase/thioredoxin